jgi:hypothetical protein
MMALDLARALDPALLAQDCGLTLDPWQADTVRSRRRRQLLCCSRQSGKSTAVAFAALDCALHEAPSLVLVLSPTQRQSGELFRSIIAYHSRLPGVPKLHAESVLRAEFANGSRILALPGTERTVRGYSACDLAILDEAARIEDDLLQAVRPMLATTDGRLIALSTPHGKRGWFYECWTGDESWHRVRVPASECPRITAEFLAEELRELGAQRFSEEYELAFLEPDSAVFPSALIDAAFSHDVRPLWA